MQQEMLHFASLSNKVESERRRHARRKLADEAGPVTVEISPGQCCSIYDVSPGGMSLRSDSYVRFPPAGRFVFTVPGSSESIEVVAQLAWVNRYGAAGLNFVEVNASAQEALAVWIAGLHRHPPVADAAPSLPRPRMSLAAIRAKAVVLRAQNEDPLQFLAEQLVALTRGTGSVIALDLGSRIECVARAGHAPAVGTVVRPDSGVSGECVRTGTIVRCDDVRHDSRVDAKIARALGFRSMIILPLRVEQKTVGILEVFAAQAHHFGSGDIALLTNLADLVLEVRPQAEQPRRAVELRAATKHGTAAAGEKPIPRLELVKPRSRPKASHPAPLPEFEEAKPRIETEAKPEKEAKSEAAANSLPASPSAAKAVAEAPSIQAAQAPTVETHRISESAATPAIQEFTAVAPTPEAPTPKPVPAAGTAVPKAQAPVLTADAPVPELLDAAVTSTGVAAPRLTSAGMIICDACGYHNHSLSRDCKACDVPLPGALGESDTKKKKPATAPFEIPEYDDRWERLRDALLKPVILVVLLIVALLLLRAHWAALRAATALWLQPDPAPAVRNVKPAPPGLARR